MIQYGIYTKIEFDGDVGVGQKTDAVYGHAYASSEVDTEARRRGGRACGGFDSFAIGKTRRIVFDLTLFGRKPDFFCSKAWTVFFAVIGRLCVF